MTVIKRSFCQSPCMAFKMARIPRLSSIFEKSDAQKFTDNALELQYILRYSIVLNGEYPDNIEGYKQFSIYRATDWFIKNHPKSRDGFVGSNLTPDRRIQVKYDGVEGKVKRLAYLGLIEEIAENSKSNATYYRFTDLGYLLAWIFESFDENKRKAANNQLYRVLQDIASHDQSSYYVFGMLEYKKYIEKEVFDELFTSILRNTISTSKRQINTMNDLITSSPFPSFNDESHTKLYLQIWQEAFNELPNEEMRTYCLHWQKLGIETLMETAPPRNIKDFEELRYDLRNNHEMLALEGMCSHCHLPSAVPVKIIEYMNRVSPSSDNFVVDKCKFCRQSRRIELPML